MTAARTILVPTMYFDFARFFSAHFSSKEKWAPTAVIHEPPNPKLQITNEVSSLRKHHLIHKNILKPGMGTERDMLDVPDELVVCRIIEVEETELRSE